jgi:hypothetical protein
LKKATTVTASSVRRKVTTGPFASARVSDRDERRNAGSARRSETSDR